MTSDEASRLAPDLQVAVMRLARRLRAERTDHGLTLTQLSVLASLQRHGPLTPGQLAAHEKVRPPSMTRTLAALTEAGLVTRRVSPDDARSVLVDLAPPAHDLLTADRALRRAWLAERLAELEPQERAALARATDLMERLAGS